MDPIVAAIWAVVCLAGLGCAFVSLTRVLQHLAAYSLQKGTEAALRIEVNRAINCRAEELLTHLKDRLVGVHSAAATDRSFLTDKIAELEKRVLDAESDNRKFSDRLTNIQFKSANIQLKR